MLAFLLGLVLVVVPADSANDLDACLEQAPVESPSPITWGEGIQQMWTGDPPVPLDTILAYLSQFREARRCFRSLDPSTIERPYLGNIMRTFHEETALLAALRRFSEALEVFREARSYLSSEPQVPSTEAGRTWWPHILHRNQGQLYYRLGDLSSAIDHYLKALQNTPRGDARQRVTYLVDVGILHQRVQDYRSARSFFERAERLFRESSLSPGDQASLRARLFYVRADLLLEETLNTDFDRSALAQARDWAERARALAESGTPRHARILIALSESQGYLGNFDAADRLNREVRAYARSQGNADLQTIALLKLGVLHLQTERWSQAGSVLTEALVLAQRLGDLDIQRRILRALGRLHELQHNWAEAEHYYRGGVAVIEDYRESLTASQWSMTAFAQWRDVHRGLVRSLLAQNRPREALAALDRSRARHLHDLRMQARVANELPPAARTRLDSLTHALTDVRNRQEKASPSEQSSLRTQEAQLMAARRALLDLASTPDRPPVDSIQAEVRRQGRALVSYFIDNPWPVYGRRPRSTAFVLTADSLQTVSLGRLTQDSIRALTNDISPLFQSTGKPAGINERQFDLRPLYRLQQALYAPVAPHLPTGAPLTVVPDGPLFHVPFSALVRRMPGGRYAPNKARFVLQERPITIELTSSLTVDPTKRAFDRSTFTPTLAAFGVSEFDTLRTVPSALRATLPEAASDSNLSLPPLPGVRKEIDLVRRLVGGTSVALDTAATELSFRSACRRAGIIHLASHAFVHPSSPLRNAFLFHPDPAGASDGVLFLHELQTQDRRIPLVVLSGCSTARGTLRGGEGMAGLQYAFRAMGAQATVSNLWPVADQASVALMEGFYRHLRAGASKDEALRQAKLAYLKRHPAKASPFFWAPVVLYGSPEPLPLNAPPQRWWFYGIAALALLGGALLGYRNRLSLLRPFR